MFVFTEDANNPQPANPWQDYTPAPRSNSYDINGNLTAFGKLYAAWDNDATVRTDKTYYIHNKNARKRLAKLDTDRSIEVRLQGWEEFDQPVDRIVSIGAFEAFKVERYPLFFEKAYKLLPDGGRMLLHTILAHTQKFFRDNGIKVTISDLKFMQFIEKEIFPGGRLPSVPDVEKLAADSGFTLERVHLLQPHYARTLDIWAENLEKNKDAALAMQGQEVYDRYMHYLTGCADFFHRGVTNVGQFTLAK